MTEHQRDTNEEIRQAANALTQMGSDVAHLLHGIVWNNPDAPTPDSVDLAAQDPAGTGWYSPTGVPDFAYGHALRISRAVNRAMQSTEDMVEDLSEWQREAIRHGSERTAGR